ncbi:MAG: hypothetical protein PF445_04800, partial [Melioribacteraceae bacterium]|nr:hypothetical protein [Melioribacteraceae bacterium]
MKKNSHYSSGYSITFEIFENEQFVKRIIVNGSEVAQNYDNTITKKQYHEGFITNDINKGNFQVKPLLMLNNTVIEANIKPIQLIIDSTQIFKPIFVKRINSLCDSSKHQLVNFQNSVPFSESEFDMLIPIYSNIENSITLKILQNNKTILTKEVSGYIL